MTKKIALLFMLILNIVFVQNTAMAKSDCVKDFYINNVQKKIEANWIIPNYSQRKSAAISITLDKDGFINDVSILRSSKDDVFDKSAVDAIYKSRSFGPLTNTQNSLKLQLFLSPVFTSLDVIDDTNKLPAPKNSNIVNVSNTATVPDFSTYTNNLQDKILSNWSPKSFRKYRNAIFSIKVDKDGTLKDIKIQKSSNKKKFDYEIVDAITKSIPFGAFPKSVNDDYKNIQIKFTYEKTEDKNAPKKTVSVGITNQDGFDKYIENVEDIVSANLAYRRYYCKKDILLEMNIDKTGKLTYVKLKNPTQKTKFIRKEFNRKTLFTLNNVSFPAFPTELKADNITIDYRVLTQRRRFFRDFIFDYAWQGFRTRLQTFYVQPTNSL